jgi:cell division protein FtsB
MAVLLVVVALLVVSYASSMRAYLQQHSQVQALQDQIANSRHQIQLLQREKQRWHDNAYVEAQARERFGWVLPGETAYQVIGKDGKPLQDTSELSNPATVGRSVPAAWWSKAWGSVRAADHPAAPKPAPASRLGPSSSKHATRPASRH